MWFALSIPPIMDDAFQVERAEEGYAYTIYAMSGQESRATDFMPVTGGDGVSGTWEAELGLKTGAYTYALERQDYATQQVDFLTLGSFDMEEQQEVEIDLSKTESVPVEVSVANLPDFMERAVVHVRGQYVPG